MKASRSAWVRPALRRRVSCSRPSRITWPRRSRRPRRGSAPPLGGAIQLGRSAEPAIAPRAAARWAPPWGAGAASSTIQGWRCIVSRVSPGDPDDRLAPVGGQLPVTSISAGDLVGHQVEQVFLALDVGVEAHRAGASSAATRRIDTASSPSASAIAMAARDDRLPGQRGAAVWPLLTRPHRTAASRPPSASVRRSGSATPYELSHTLYGQALRCTEIVATAYGKRSMDDDGSKPPQASIPPCGGWPCRSCSARS